MLMSEHFVGFPPSGGTRKKAHSGKGPFRSSYKTLTKLFSLHRKSHQNLSLLNFKCAARISTPRGTLIHKRARMRTGNLANDPYKIIKGTRVLSVWEWQQLISTPKRYQFKHKKLKNPKNKNSSINVLQRLKSDH